MSFDPDTMEGDYAEAYHHMYKIWDKVPVDTRFDFNKITTSPQWEQFKKEAYEKAKRMDEEDEH